MSGVGKRRFWGFEKEQINITPKSNKYFPSFSQHPNQAYWKKKIIKNDRNRQKQKNLLVGTAMSASSGRKEQPNGGDDEPDFSYLIFQSPEKYYCHSVCSCFFFFFIAQVNPMSRLFVVSNQKVDTISLCHNHNKMSSISVFN